MTKFIPIPDFDGYSVSKCGRIMGKLKELTPHKHHRERGKKAYLRVEVWHNNKRKKLYVHTAVLLAWHGPKPSDKHLGCHRDDNAMNNHADNLYWGTHAENYADLVRNSKT